MKLYSEGKIPCFACGKHYTSARRLREHITLKHERIKEINTKIKEKSPSLSTPAPSRTQNPNTMKKSAFDSPDVSTSETKDISLMQIEPSQLGNESNASELKDTKLQIKRLEKETTAVKNPRTDEFSEISKTEKLYKEPPPDDDNLDYNEKKRKPIWEP